MDILHRVERAACIANSVHPRSFTLRLGSSRRMGRRRHFRLPRAQRMGRTHDGPTGCGKRPSRPGPAYRQGASQGQEEDGRVRSQEPRMGPGRHEGGCCQVGKVSLNCFVVVSVVYWTVMRWGGSRNGSGKEMTKMYIGSDESVSRARSFPALLTCNKLLHTSTYPAPAPASDLEKKNILIPCPNSFQPLQTTNS